MDKRPLMVIFGAGASYDGVPGLGDAADPLRLPLARSLFAEKFTRHFDDHRVAGGLIAELRRLPSTVSLETELDRIQNEEAPTDFTRRRALVALRYYLRDLLWETGEAAAAKTPGYTNYHELLTHLARWRERTGGTLTLVSFNYDWMLDQAVEEVFPIRLRTIDAYIADSTVRVLRPHGCVRWIRTVEDTGTGPAWRPSFSPEETERWIIDLAGHGGLQLGSTYLVVGDAEHTNIGGNRPAVPALTVPILNKRDFEFPADHEAAFVESVSGLVYLLVIGWRATEGNFLSRWGQAPRHTQPRMQVVNGSAQSGAEVLGRLEKAGIRWSQWNAFDGGFTDFLKSTQLASFLDAPLPGLEAVPTW